MKVTKHHQVDASERGEDGLYDWYYEYDVYEFEFGNLEVVARSYVNEPDEVSILSIHQCGERLYPIRPSSFERPELLQVLKYLVKVQRKDKLKYLGTRGYSLIQPKYINQACDT